ncbi:hypothetical protein M0R45_016422 [Rubus argutus]|uniref:Uncharacterized protein n=1 Tax=Rubus argutus TaxID=59490 RepID=A0AAW1XUZ9_RUBAR
MARLHGLGTADWFLEFWAAARAEWVDGDAVMVMAWGWHHYESGGLSTAAAMAAWNHGVTAMGVPVRGQSIWMEAELWCTGL